MSLIGIVLVLAIVGFCLYLLLNYVPMPAPIRTVIVALVVIVLIAWIMDAFGLVDIGSLRGRHPLR
jgi:hypothetical protein